MSLLQAWASQRTALETSLHGTDPVAAGELLSTAVRGLVRPYSDQQGITALQSAYAAYVLDTLALAPPALLVATTTSVQLRHPPDSRFSDRRPGMSEAVLWLTLITIVCAILTVLFAFGFNPIIAVVVGAIAVLSFVGTVSTIVKLQPAVVSFAKRYGRRSVPLTLRLVLSLIPTRATADPDPVPSPAITTEVAAEKCLRWLDCSVRAVDGMLDKLVVPDQPTPDWLANENTADAVQELLGAVLRRDAKRRSSAAEGLAAAIVAEGVMAVVFDGTNGEFFDTAPSGRASTETLRPALVRYQPSGPVLMRRGLIAGSIAASTERRR